MFLVFFFFFYFPFGYLITVYHTLKKLGITPWVSNSNAPSVILVDKKLPTSETKTKFLKVCRTALYFWFQVSESIQEITECIYCSAIFHNCILIFKIMNAPEAGD